MSTSSNERGMSLRSPARFLASAERLAEYIAGRLRSALSERGATNLTSITVGVEVYAQRNPTDVICVKVTEASLTYVAVGADRRPRELPAK